MCCRHDAQQGRHMIVEVRTLQAACQSITDDEPGGPKYEASRSFDVFGERCELKQEQVPRPSQQKYSLAPFATRASHAWT